MKSYSDLLDESLKERKAEKERIKERRKNIKKEKYALQHLIYLHAHPIEKLIIVSPFYTIIYLVLTFTLFVAHSFGFPLELNAFAYALPQSYIATTFFGLLITSKTKTWWGVYFKWLFVALAALHIIKVICTPYYYAMRLSVIRNIEFEFGLNWVGNLLSNWYQGMGVGAFIGLLCLTEFSNKIRKFRVNNK